MFENANILKSHIKKYLNDIIEQTSYLNTVNYDRRCISSVLVIIHYINTKPNLLLTKRSKLVQNHKNEISFPGGKFSPNDKNLINTALRETYEEINLNFTINDILGSLNSVTTLTSNFLIIPYVTILEKIDKPKLLEDEVEEIINAPLIDLFSSLSRDYVNDTEIEKAYKFSYNSAIIWGATARIIKQLYDILYIK